MKSRLNQLYKNQSLIYKGFLFLVSTILIVYLFPKGGKFKYEFQKGKPWQYENLEAPFDFPIYKSETALEAEKTATTKNHIPYYQFDVDILNQVKADFENRFDAYFEDSVSPTQFLILKSEATKLLLEIYKNGVISEDDKFEGDKLVNLIKEKEVTIIPYESFFSSDELSGFVDSRLKNPLLFSYANDLKEIFKDIVSENVSFDENFTSKSLDEALKNIASTRGNIEEGDLIIAKDEVVEGETYEILNSLKKEFQSQLWNAENYYWIVFGYTILIALVLLMLLLFLRKYRPDIFSNNNKVTFIFFNVIIMIFLTTLLVKYQVAYVYVVPLCILPLILKAFFDARLGLFTHVLTVLLLGFIVPNSFEYVFLQIIAGIVTIQTISELYKRANLFISVGQITLIYIIAYFAFFIIHEGNLQNISWITFGLFILNGLATLFAQPLIYIYEKVFGLISDVSLLELSDTNSKLLKELSNKAPGTFHHSLQVANLAEAAANEIGANAMLVRVGALYHDVGKMNAPSYFTENQTTSVNPHNDLSPQDSAEIIINHVIEGIEIARKNKLPDRIIDFIRTHHGSSLVYYFFKKQEEMSGEVDEKKFRYPGPIPFSRETAILMMSDAVEAASKSLKNPTFPIIDAFVEKIVDKQIEEGQFLNADITFKEIELIKKVLKKKLTNIYHLRVEYPE